MTDGARAAGKVVVVTGAASGQGAAEAAALAREGATVVATDVHEEAPGAAAAPGEVGGGLAYRRLDVSRPEDWAAVTAWVAERHGRIDGLVNNAGVVGRWRLDEVALDDWERVLRVNLTGPMLGIQAVLPFMGRGGSIVNVGSVAALTANASVAYTVSKWGVRGLSRVASMELGPRGIRVNAIHPGYIETAMTASAAPGFRNANVAGTPLGRTGTVDDVAPLVVFLISDESAYISGVDIPVDGGLSGHGGAKALADAVLAARP